MWTLGKYFTLLLIYIVVTMLLSCNYPENNMPLPNEGLYSINIDGTNQTELFSVIGFDFYFVGNKIIYSNLYSANLDGSDSHALAPDSLISLSFSVSPDRSKIIFSINYRDIYIMNSDGSGLSRINIPDTSNKYYPSLSYDDNYLTYGNAEGVFQIGTNGSNFKMLRGNNTKKVRFLLTAYCANTKILYSDYNDSTTLFQSLHLIDTQNLSDTVLFSLGNSFGGYYEVSNSNKILYTNNDYIHEYDVSSRVDKVITQGVDAHYSVDFSKITYRDMNSSMIYLMDLPTNKISQLKTSFSLYNIAKPRLTPDGTKIIFIGVVYSN